MTQSKSKPKQGQGSPLENVYRLVGQCSSEELEELVEEINKLLWLRAEIIKGENSGPSIPAEHVFDELKQRLKSK